MKKILNNIGAISKQAIVGGAIAVATLMVGVGLMNNFSSDGEGEQGFASNAMERGYSSYESSYSGASADEILSARNYAQGSREGKLTAITGADRLALNRRAGVQKATGVAQNQQNAGLEDNSTGYGEGEIEGMGTSSKVDIAVSAEDAAAAKAQRDAKIAKGQALGEQARSTLKTSKMADASGIKGLPTGSTSMTYGTLGGSQAGIGAGDSAKVALAKANMPNLQGANGRLGAMGSSSKEAEGKRIGRASIGQNYESLGDLGRASKYSMSGKNAVVSDAAKGAADVAAAFDGSKEAEVANLAGENLQKAANSALQDMGGPDLSSLNKDLKLIDDTVNQYNEAAKKARNKMQIMMMAAGIAFAASLAVILAKAGGPWCYLIAGAICTAGAAVISGFMWGGEFSYANCLNQMVELSNNNNGIGLPGKGSMWSPWALFGLLNGLMAMSFLGALAGSIGSAAGAAGGAAGAAAEAGAAAGSGIGSALGSSISGIGKSIMEMIIGAKKS
ncbi:MAG: hypothetical protein II972_05855 [Elusimicrobiaceae bacterium]|nr:hypothetical protein [Elusimicrobiaceae bacterium]